MGLIKKSIFYQRARKDIEEFIAKGNKIEDLSATDPLYMRIKNSRCKDENGKKLTLEEKFELLGFPRKRKYSSDVRSDLINAINEYVENGGSFHIERKKLPFYNMLETYTRSLKRSGKNLSHEEIMKNDLGFKNFSDSYYRSMPLFEIYKYDDGFGFIDEYKKNRVLANFVKDLSITYNVPYYFIIVFLADRELKSYHLPVDKIKYIERLLKNYAIKNKSFVGIKRKDPHLFEMFEYLTRYYSDGTESLFSKQDWIQIFGLGDVENRFRDIKQQDIDIDNIMLNIKEQKPSGFVVAKDLDIKTYRKIIIKSVNMGISVQSLFNAYGLDCKGSSIARLTRVHLDELPYMKDMKELFNEKLKLSGITKDAGFCEEEIFEQKIKAMQEVYLEFKNKLENYLPEDLEEIEIQSNDATI